MIFVQNIFANKNYLNIFFLKKNSFEIFFLSVVCVGGKTRWLIFILTKQIKYNKNKNGSNLVKGHKKSYLVEIQQVLC